MASSEYNFQSPYFLGESCEDIYNMNPESHNRSGYYWITNGLRLTQVYCGMTYTESSCEDIFNNNPETGDKSGYYRINDTQWTYCDMMATTCFAGDVGVGGGWKRIVNIDISAGDDCPSGWRKETFSGVSFCRMVRDERRTCSSTIFSTNGTSYQRVCGRARGYQRGLPHSFWSYHREDQTTIDGYYADGLLITYGSPRQHIWTYTIGAFDNHTANLANCPCAVGGGLAPPPFVGTDYYCESGGIDAGDTTAYYFNDPLWDGSGCITSNCCDNPTQPWFYQEISERTTSDIEARICSFNFSGGLPLIDQLELYIQ